MEKSKSKNRITDADAASKTGVSKKSSKMEKRKSSMKVSGSKSANASRAAAGKKEVASPEQNGEAAPKKKTAQEFERVLADKIILNSREIRYDIIKQIAKKTFGWRCTRWKPDKETGSAALTHAKADWDILWIDADFHIGRLNGLKPYQKINHFPGMTIISLKNNLAKYLKLMQTEMPL